MEDSKMFCSHCGNEYFYSTMIQSIGFNEELKIFYTINSCPTCAPSLRKDAAEKVRKKLRKKSLIENRWQLFCQSHEWKTLESLDAESICSLMELHSAQIITKSGDRGERTAE